MSPTLAAIAAAPTRRRDAGLGPWSLSLSLHAACAMLLAQPAPPAPRHAPIVTEVELATPEPPPRESAPPPPEALPVEPVPEVARRAAPPPRPPARAGALLTAADPPQRANAEEPAPVRFVTDAHGRGFGYGVVARGGSALHGEGGAARTNAEVRPAPARAGRQPTLEPAPHLTREPKLRDHGGCRGYFPQSARRAHGQVALVATVRADGVIAGLEVESESPQGEGFASAARACLGPLRFIPALDARGAPTAARTRVVIHFSR